MAAHDFFVAPRRIADWSEHARTSAQEIQEWHADEIADVCVQYLSAGRHRSACAVLEVSLAPVTDKTLEERFRGHAERWDQETAHLSSPLQRMENPNYQAIMGMSAEGPDIKRSVIQLMLRDLKTKHRDWFLALSYLTQKNPINPKDYGKTSKLVQAWVKWGEEQGYI